MPDFLRILANELQQIALTGERIEACILNDRRMTRAGAAGAPTALQGLDHLVQTATELARFLETLSERADSRVRVAVSAPAAAVRLRALAEALAGHAPAAQDQVPPFPSGELDLF